MENRKFVPIPPEPLAGFLNLLKPPGMTSNDAVQAIKYALRPKVKDITIGHAGTLDPEASGILPLMLGRGARLFSMLTDKKKEYIAEWVPGAATDTQDATGKVLAFTDTIPDDAALEAVLPRFIGEIEQRPCAYSALKRNGVPAYELARNGEAVELEPRTVVIDKLEWIGKTQKGRLLRIVCGRGVYIRALCQDIGEAVGCAAHMGFLLRTAAGLFKIRHSVTIEEALEAIAADGRYLKRFRRLMTPMDAPVLHLPKAEVNNAAGEKLLRTGNPMKRVLLTPNTIPNGTYRLYANKTFMGVAEIDDRLVRLTYRLI